MPISVRNVPSKGLSGAFCLSEKGLNPKQKSRCPHSWTKNWVFITLCFVLFLNYQHLLKPSDGQLEIYFMFYCCCYITKSCLFCRLQYATSCLWHAFEVLSPQWMSIFWVSFFWMLVLHCILPDWTHGVLTLLSIFVISMDSLMFGLTCLSHHLYIYYYPRNLLM